MPSYLSESRGVLHLVVASPLRSSALAEVLALLRPQDAIVLMQDAATAAVASVALSELVEPRMPGARVYVVTADLAARGLAAAHLREGVVAIGYVDLVDLVAAHPVCQTWTA